MLPIAVRRTAGPLAVAGALLVAVAGCSEHDHAPGHDDHAHAAGEPLDDHGHGAATDELEPVVVTEFTEKVELFMEYPRLTPGAEGRFLAHVTLLATGEPVRSGTLRLVVTGPEGSLTFAASRPARDGLFVPVGAIGRAGTYDASVTVESEQVTDTITLPRIVVHASPAAAAEAAAAEAETEPADVVPFLLEQQWKVGLLLATAERGRLTRRVRAPGVVEAPPGARAVVSPPLAGRLLPPESGAFPRLGERVEKGQVLALVEPPLGVGDAAQLAANRMALTTLAMELDLRRLDLRTNALEAEQQALQAQSRRTFARQTLERIEALRAKGLGTAAELAEARHQLDVAERDVAAFEALRVSYEEARTELEAIRARSGAGGESGPLPSAVPLLAPIAGEIVAAPRTVGEHVAPDDAAFEILDARRVWVSAEVPEFDLALLEREPHALVELASQPGRVLDVTRDLDGALAHFGRVVAPESRTVTVRYACSNVGGALHVGQMAEVFLAAGSADDAVVVPAEAVVKEDGRPVVFVLLDGESFQKRHVEIGVRDGARVQVVSGVAPGERVVTKGASIVKLAAASPASFGHGHAH